jgi:nucleoside-diphosphate-sugar epimerase
MKLLITGGCGFIGTHTVELAQAQEIGQLLRDDAVVMLDDDGTLPRAMSTPSRDRLSGNPVDDFDD